MGMDSKRPTLRETLWRNAEFWYNRASKYYSEQLDSETAWQWFSWDGWQNGNSTQFQGVNLEAVPKRMVDTTLFEDQDIVVNMELFLAQILPDLAVLAGEYGPAIRVRKRRDNGGRFDSPNFIIEVDMLNGVTLDELVRSKLTTDTRGLWTSDTVDEYVEVSAQLEELLEQRSRTSSRSALEAAINQLQAKLKHNRYLDGAVKQTRENILNTRYKPLLLVVINSEQDVRGRFEAELEREQYEQWEFDRAKWAGQQGVKPTSATKYLIGYMHSAYCAYRCRNVLYTNWTGWLFLQYKGEVVNTQVRRELPRYGIGSQPYGPNDDVVVQHKPPDQAVGARLAWPKCKYPLENNIRAQFYESIVSALKDFS